MRESLTPCTNLKIFGFSVDFTMDFTKISLDLSLNTVHIMIYNQVQVHPWS